MTLLETITKLREMDQKAAKELPPGTMQENAAFCLELRNAAQEMLAVLKCFQKGDAKLLGDLIYIEEDSAKFQAGFGKISAPMREMIDMLTRMREAARRMEECSQ